ncbi:MAG: putative membrane protein, partial [Planctomycetota bacterium]
EKPASANRAPVIWDALNGTRDLILVLEAAGVDVSAWRDTAGNTFMQATGISADGKTIVGYGNFDNSRRAWVATL